MKLSEILSLVAGVLFAQASTSFAQTTWTDGAGNASWIDILNWSSGVPTSTSAVVFANPISVVGVDTGGTTTVQSITVQGGTSAFSILPFGGETLVVNGDFINNSSEVVDVSLDYTVGSSATLDGPIDFNGLLNLGTRTASISGEITLNSLVSLQINNSTASGYGRLNLGSGSSLTFTAGVGSIQFSPSSTYTGVNGDVFNLLSNSGGTLTGFSASSFNISTLPTLTGGLSWNTSALSTGTLSVVPEPGTVALATLGLTALLIFRRRRND